MTVLSAQSIIGRCAYSLNNLITPFHHRTISNGKSYGLSSCGYDIRIDLKGESLELPPGACYLASSVEHICMPDDLVAIVHDKSSWARRFLTLQNTVLEPGWRGFITLELVNHSNGFVNIADGDPIAQLMFHKLDAPTIQPYKGKYQNQPDHPVEAIDEPNHA